MFCKLKRGVDQLHQFTLRTLRGTLLNYALVNSCLFEETGTKFWGDINVSQFITTNKVKNKKQKTLLSKVLNCHITKSNDSQHIGPFRRAQWLLGIKHYLDLGKKHGTSEDPGDRCAENICAILSWSPQAFCISSITWPTVGKHENSSLLKMLLARAERTY